MGNMPSASQATGAGRKIRLPFTAGKGDAGNKHMLHYGKRWIEPVFRHLRRVRHRHRVEAGSAGVGNAGNSKLSYGLNLLRGQSKIGSKRAEHEFKRS